MFRKKQTKNPVTRNVRPQQTANVFSYYASRSPAADSQRQAQSSSPVRQRRLRLSKSRLLAYSPSLAAGLVLVSCLVYVSTLDAHPKLQVVGNQRETGLISGVEAYQDGVNAVFGESLTSRSKLLINTDALAQKLRQKYPELGEIAVVLPLIDRRPVIQVQPAEPALVLIALEGTRVVDENGRIIADAQDIDSSVRDSLPILRDESGLNLDQGGYGLPAATVAFVRTITAQLKQKNHQIESLTLPPVTNELRLRLNGTPYFVKFDVRGDGRLQAGTLIATKEKLDADRTTPREYLDVRVPGKVYYK